MLSPEQITRKVKVVENEMYNTVRQQFTYGQILKRQKNLLYRNSNILRRQVSTIKKKKILEERDFNHVERSR